MNTYSCWPGKGNVLPAELEETCYEYVERAIRLMRPTVILCMGNTPLKFLTGKAGGIQSLSGQYDYIPRWGALVVYCVHPSSIFRDPENEPRFRKAMRSLKKFI
jgi:uracil-DNA glycosylase family 4